MASRSSKSRRPSPSSFEVLDPARRRALLFHDDTKGLLKALITFEDGGTTIAQYFPSQTASMRRDIRLAKQALIKEYEITPGNIRTKIANLDPPNHSPS